jgi:hypothetical protein
MNSIFGVSVSYPSKLRYGVVTESLILVADDASNAAMSKP